MCLNTLSPPGIESWWTGAQPFDMYQTNERVHEQEKTIINQHAYTSRHTHAHTTCTRMYVPLSCLCFNLCEEKKGCARRTDRTSTRFFFFLPSFFFVFLSHLRRSYPHLGKFFFAYSQGGKGGEDVDGDSKQTVRSVD